MEVDDLRMAYGATAAGDGLSLAVARGSITAVIGPNGAGKTTTLETCEGYRKPQSGTVRVLGLDPQAQRRDLLPRIGVMLQSGGAWSGVRAVNPIWLRAAGAMGANERTLFWKVIVPGASPFIITGLRQAFLRAWIAVIGAEFLAASDFGLGWVIFDAKEFLNAPLMLASLIVIGAIGFAFERLVFGSIEKATVLRWGMVRMVKG